LRDRDGTFTLFDVPGSKGTNATSNNPSGASTGSYYDANYELHGFLRTP
jgi:hypothetical protein